MQDKANIECYSEVLHTSQLNSSSCTSGPKVQATHGRIRTSESFSKCLLFGLLVNFDQQILKKVLDELKSALKLIIDNLDSKSSLYFCLSGVDTSNLDQLVRWAFNRIDTDRNGTITFDEFANSDWALEL